MEDLIWRYIDGECTEYERIDVETRLKSDPDFRSEYQETLALNQMLSQASVTTLNHSFKQQLNTAILSTVSQRAKVELFPRSWVIGLVALAVLGILTALRFQGTESSYLSLPHLDEKSINMISWVITSFLVLVGLDQGFRKWLTFRKSIQLNLM